MLTIRRVDVLPAVLSTHDVVDLFSLELRAAGHLLLNGKVVGTSGASPFVSARIILTDEEDIRASGTEEHFGRTGGTLLAMPGREGILCVEVQ